MCRIFKKTQVFVNDGDSQKPVAEFPAGSWFCVRPRVLPNDFLGG